MNSTVKAILTWALILVAAIGLWNLVEKKSGTVPIFSLSDFMDKVANDSVAEVTVLGSNVRGRLRGGNQEFKATIPPGYTALYDQLLKARVKVTVISEGRQAWPTLLMSWFMPLLVAFGFGWLCASWSHRRRPQPPMTAA